jgi:hypothetical protein
VVAVGAEVVAVSLHALDPCREVACCAAVLEALGCLVHFLLRALVIPVVLGSW